MGAAGIRLDPATVTIAAIVLGLIVDDTVHLLYRLRTELGRQDAGADRAAALHTTMGSAGRAIVATTLVMTLGFSVFAFSEIRSLVTFGLLIALVITSYSIHYTKLYDSPRSTSPAGRTRPASPSPRSA